MFASSRHLHCQVLREECNGLAGLHCSPITWPRRLRQELLITSPRCIHFPIGKKRWKALTLSFPTLFSDWKMDTTRQSYDRFLSEPSRPSYRRGVYNLGMFVMNVNLSTVVSECWAYNPQTRIDHNFAALCTFFNRKKALES